MIWGNRNAKAAKQAATQTRLASVGVSLAKPASSATLAKAHAEVAPWDSRVRTAAVVFPVHQAGPEQETQMWAHVQFVRQVLWLLARALQHAPRAREAATRMTQAAQYVLLVHRTSSQRKPIV